ncbi:LLM class flavin-dependent oxidoreductase [Kouleothrix sp.]|mgnify:CR=1 FL=1|uniref:LLM class flavin-dependent oxidoreductase n=1 Tax=Kouleothrix sp. TaxID=2779161 RepID=UPI003919BB8C
MDASATQTMKIGLVMPIAEDDALGGTPSYATIRAHALRAEAAGFDSIWVYDHLLFRFGEKPTAGIWESWSMLAALAEATRRVQLGTIVMCVPFRNPALLAKMADTLDEISGGRLILGLGSGWHQPEFDAFGVPFDHKVDRFEEALQIITPLLREGRVDFSGSYYRAPNCELRPRGPRPHGPEILIGSFKPRMHGLVARYADSWNTAWLGQPTLLAERRAGVEAACAAAGRDPASLGVTVGVHLMYLDAGTPPSEPPERVLTGSPAEVAAALREYAAQGVDHLICSIDKVSLDAVDWLAEAVRLARP